MDAPDSSLKLFSFFQTNLYSFSVNFQIIMSFRKEFLFSESLNWKEYISTGFVFWWRPNGKHSQTRFKELYSLKKSAGLPRNISSRFWYQNFIRKVLLFQFFKIKIHRLWAVPPFRWGPSRNSFWLTGVLTTTW